MKVLALVALFLVLSLSEIEGHRRGYQKVRYFRYKPWTYYGHRRYYYKPTYYKYHYGHYLHKRSVQENEIQDSDLPVKAIDDDFMKADFQDVEDCAKKFVCGLFAKDQSDLDPMELRLKSEYEINAKEILDVSKESAQFNFAAYVGQEAGIYQCNFVYSKCAFSYDDLKWMWNSYPIEDEESEDEKDLADIDAKENQ